MDFLTLFAIYVALVLTCIFLVCKYSGQQHSPFTVLFDVLAKVRNVERPYDPYLNGRWVALLTRINDVSPQVFAPFTPKWVQRFSQWVFHRLFHQRFVSFICFISARCPMSDTYKLLHCVLVNHVSL